MSSNHVSAIAHEPPAQVDWQSWLQRWDIQQTGYLSDREARFNAMLDVLMRYYLKPLWPWTSPVALEPLASGCWRGFHARCVAVDLDPVLLTMGQSVLGTMGGRLRWVTVDLTTAEWSAELETQFDAVLSTTALHWLAAEHLVRLYRQLGQLVRPGVVLNGDHEVQAVHGDVPARGGHRQGTPARRGIHAAWGGRLDRLVARHVGGASPARPVCGARAALYLEGGRTTYSYL